MQVYSISEARTMLGELVNQVRYQKKTIALGHAGRAEVLIVAFAADEAPVTDINAASESFSFLEDEPNLYSVNDLKKRYV